MRRPIILFFIALSSQSYAETCKPMEEKVLSQLMSYSRAIRHRNLKSAERRLGHLQSTLKQALHSSECRDSVLPSYLIQVSNLYDWTNAPRHENGEKKLATMEHVAGSVSRVFTTPITEAALEYWVKLLLKQNRLTPLTSEYRAQLGGIWNEKKKERYVIYGAYDCASTQIYYDPSLPPYDLASALFHEIGHLLRDKAQVFENQDPIFTHDWDIEHDPVFSLEASIYLDELFSTLQGAYYQARLMRDRTKPDMYGKQGRWKRPLETEFDLTMTDPKGPLHQLLTEAFEIDTQFGPMGMYPWNKTAAFPRFIDTWIKIMQWGANSKASEKNSTSRFITTSSEAMNNILRKIIRAYGMNLNESEIKLWIDLIIYEYKLQNYQKYFDLLTIQTDPFTLTFSKHEAILTKIKDRSVTLSCSQSMTALKNGRLKSYLGSALVRPGVEGSRTNGVEGSRTEGVEGSRTGGGVEGSRTGDSMIRPSSAVKACIHTGI